MKTVYQLEEWRTVIGLEKYLEVSNEGHLRSIRRTHPRGGFKGGRILKLSLSIHGYLFARVSHGLDKTNVYVHRSVAVAFLNNNSALPQVNHIDGIKINNHSSNLEWCTASHNSLHKFSVIGHKPVNKLPVVAFSGDSIANLASLNGFMASTVAPHTIRTRLLHYFSFSMATSRSRPIATS